MNDHENQPLPPLSARNKYGVSEVVSLRMQPSLAAEIDGFIGIDGFKSRSEYLRHAAVYYAQHLRTNGIIGNELAKLEREADSIDAVRSSCSRMAEKAAKMLVGAMTVEQRNEAKDFCERTIVVLADYHYDCSYLRSLLTGY